MAVHIGKIIKNLVRTKGIKVTEFADKINYSRRNVYEIFDKPTIDTGLLLKISKVLGENLFLNYITDKEIASHRITKEVLTRVSRSARDVYDMAIESEEELSKLQQKYDDLVSKRKKK